MAEIFPKAAAMRILPLAFAFLVSGIISAQNYIQNAMPVQQTQPADDCYTRNLDMGNAALLRNEPREAIRFFTLAKNCPDAQGNTRRQTELANRIAHSGEQLGLNKTTPIVSSKPDKTSVPRQKRTSTSETPNTRRNYQADPVFLKDTLDDCFLKLMSEGDRAYRLKFWEDAAAMYRAAKNCNDAAQKDRQLMSEKITNCRNSAENELFAKQQEAERQARHAIAANLADDAQELLRSKDRSLAFRLADFANQYIAPDDNPDCVQAMFDAWYYQPTEDSKKREDELYKPVFCYELADNLGESTQLKFVQQANGKQLLWAFVPKEGDMYAWEMPSMKLVQEFGTGEGNNYIGFDFSPDGNLLFWGNKFFDLRNGARSYRVEVPEASKWCFNGRGDEFFYHNVSEKKIYLLDVREAFAQQSNRRGSKNNNMIQLPIQREIVTHLPDGLKSMKYLNGNFWLGFSDRIEILSKDQPGKPWKRERVFKFEGVTIPDFVEQKDLELQMYPEDSLAILSYNLTSWIIKLGDDPSNAQPKAVGKLMENMFPLAVSPQTQQIACQYTGNYLSTGFWLMDFNTGDTLLRQLLPNYTNYASMSGSFSPNANWIAATNSNGSIHVWSLHDTPTTWTSELPSLPDNAPIFSPDGNRLFISFADTLSILNTNNPAVPAYIWNGVGNTLRGASDQWAMLQISPDSAEARDLSSGRRLRFPLSNPSGVSFLYDFDNKEGKLVAYLTDLNRVEVRSLKTGELVSSKSFEGGSIEALHFIPGSDKLLIQQLISIGGLVTGQTSVKIWSPLMANEKARSLRLHEYSVTNLALEGSGRLAAFSNGADIRIFELKNIENELLKIPMPEEEYVQCIAFRPNSSLIAAAYLSGKVIFWNLETGQASLQLQAIPSNRIVEGTNVIASIGFSHDGNILNLVTLEGHLLAYALDPSYIREVVQNDTRQLQTLSIDQIVRYNLEAALYYPGNFERLAESGDAPLVRTFFRHFGEQARESNNIERVRDYCERSFYLYEHLDPNTQKHWKLEMALMYEDYAWKLLLRNKINESSAIFRFLKTTFDDQPVQLNAHIALLRREYVAASALYTQYLLTDQNGILTPWEARYNFEDIEKQMTQLLDYELIDSTQINCFCGTVALSGGFSSFCPEGKRYPAIYQSPADKIRWEIFQNRDAENNATRFTTKVTLLEDALQKAKGLAKLDPKTGQLWLEILTIELAKVHRNFGMFEQKSPDAISHFEKATQLLTSLGPFKDLADTSRYALLSATYLACGKQLLEGGQSANAITQLNLGLEAAQPLTVATYGADTSLLRIYYDNLVGPLFEKLGTAYLLEGYPVESRQAYDQANIYFVSYGGLNTLYQATVSIFENDEIQAFLDFGNIFDPSQTALALFNIGLLTERFPEQRVRLEAVIPRIEDALASKNPRLVNTEYDYYFSKYKIDYFAAQEKWDSAAQWSRTALLHAKRGMDMPNASEIWTIRWLDEHIDVPYYLLLSNWNKPAALEDCIRTAENAELFLEKKGSEKLYYANRELLNTNLAHALVLRNKPGDRDRAMELYKHFIEAYVDPRGFDNLDLLEKDFRDLKRAGAPWPEFPELH